MRIVVLDKNLMSKIVFIISFLFISLNAREVLVSDIQSESVLMKVATLKSQTATTNVINKLNANGYDTLTLKHDAYEIYITNISPKNFENSLQDIRKKFPTAYKSRKKSFSTNGIILLETPLVADSKINFLDTSLSNEPSISIDSNETLPNMENNISLILDQKITEVKIAQIDDNNSNEKLSKYLLSDSSSESNISENFSQNINSTITKKVALDENQTKIDLIDAVLQSLSINHKLKASREKVLQAKYNVDIAYGDYLPSIDASYTVVKTEKRPGDMTPEQTYKRAKYYTDEKYALTLSQNIYAGGETTNEAERLKAQYLVAKTDFERLLEEEIAKAVTAYIDVVFNRDSMEVNKKNIEELETVFQIVKAKFDAGALSIGELSSIEASVSNAKSQLSKTSSKYNNALEYFKFITGELFQETYPYEKIIHVEVPSIEEIIEKVPEKNTLIKNFNYNILSKKFNLKKLKAPFRPKIDLVLAAEKITDKENFEMVEDSYIAKLLVSYNIFNGNKDKNMYLKTFSSIQEVMFEKEAEIRKIKWELEKLHTSLTSLQDNLSNVEDEVNSSKNMVESYWESFRNGEQDLHVLLQGQRQLNTAELDLITSQQNSMKDYFNILKISGDLMSYFKIDTNEENYLDMARAKYRAQYKKPKEEKSVIIESPIKKEDINATNIIDNQQAKITDTNDTTLSHLLSFHEKFLIENPEKFTIVLNDFQNPLEGLQKISNLNISKNSFIYEYFEDQKIKTKIAYGIFDSFEDANKTISESITLKDEQNISKIASIGKIQEEFKEFSTLFFVNANDIPKVVIPPKIAQPKEKPFETDQAFKDKFLNAPKDYFTINITTLSSMQTAGKLLKQENIEFDTFVFKFGDDEKWYKLMYGVFETYESAKTALDSLGRIKTTYIPIIEKISQKQELYKRFNKQ